MTLTEVSKHIRVKKKKMAIITSLDMNTKCQGHVETQVRLILGN